MCIRDRDSTTQAWLDLQTWQPDALDTVVGIAASGTTPYVAVSYTHLRAHETVLDLVCRLLLEKKKDRKHKT